MMMKNLQTQDPEIYNAIQRELERQRNGLELIASENLVSEAVLEAMGTILTNKYSEGYPGKRYYAGNEYIDVSENLAIERAKKLFGAEHVNVQPHAGSQANMAAYFAILNHGDTILGMNLAHGGHLTHGSPVNFSGKLYNIVSYGVNRETGYIDMDEVERLAIEHKPKLILVGFSAYSRKVDFSAFRVIADKVGAYLMADIAHVAGLIAAKVYPDPVPYCDIVTTTTHKTLRGPRGAIIISKIEDRFRPDDKKNLAQKIDSAVFPGMQGGPLEHIIAAKAVAFGEALRPEFIEYQKQVMANARVLAETLLENGIKLVSGGTDSHLVLVDLTNLECGGKEAEVALEKANIHTNKNMIPYDPRTPVNPSGIRLGTPALTTRGMKEEEMKIIGKMISDILKDVNNEELILRIKNEVLEMTEKFPIYEGLK
ncbi:MAG: serine hydroxymethyltransferase [bacterium]